MFVRKSSTIANRAMMLWLDEGIMSVCYSADVQPQQLNIRGDVRLCFVACCIQDLEQSGKVQSMSEEHFSVVEIIVITQICHIVKSQRCLKTLKRLFGDLFAEPVYCLPLCFCLFCFYSNTFYFPLLHLLEQKMCPNSHSHSRFYMSITSQVFCVAALNWSQSEILMSISLSIENISKIKQYFPLARSVLHSVSSLLQWLFALAQLLCLFDHCMTTVEQNPLRPELLYTVMIPVW